MLAPALAAALAGPQNRAVPPFPTQPAPALAQPVPAASGDMAGDMAGGDMDWLDLSAAAQKLLDGLRAGTAPDTGAPSIAQELLAGDIGDYLEAALERLASEIEKVFRLLGMSAADAAAAAAGLASPMAARARASVESFHMESSAISASSEVTATGSRQSLSLVVQSIDIAVDRKTGTVTVTQQSLSVSVEVRTGDMVQSDPLILDLAGNGIALAAVGDRLFDLDGDGKLDRPAWVAGDDALLALDRDGNGAIDDGRELFGDQNGAADGFGELARFDVNGDGGIDAADPAFAKLKLLFADGRQDALADHGIVRLRLGAVVPLGIDVAGGRLVAAGGFDRADGSAGEVVEALFDMSA
jgi:hypothetical protein